jgi:hypothetical protein
MIVILYVAIQFNVSSDRAGFFLYHRPPPPAAGEKISRRSQGISYQFDSTTKHSQPRAEDKFLNHLASCKPGLGGDVRNKSPFTLGPDRLDDWYIQRI